MADHIDKDHTTPQPWKYWAVVITIFVAMPILLATTLLVAPDLFGGIEIGSVRFHNTYLLLALIALYFVASWQNLDTREWGGVTVFSQPAAQIGPGPIFAPLGLMRVLRAPRFGEEDQFPADPEMIQKQPDEFPLGPDQVRPIRVMSGPPEADGTGILNVQMAVELTMSVIWHVEQDHFFDFWISIPGDTWPEMKAQIRKRMRDTAENELTVQASLRPVSKIVSDLQTLNQIVRDELQKEVADWGICIDNAKLQSPDVSHDVNISLTRIPIARADAEASGIAAEAIRRNTVTEAEGAASARERLALAREAELAAEGAGLKKAADILEMTGADYYAGQVAKEVIGKGDVIIGGDGIAQAVFGLSKSIFPNAGKKGEPDASA